MSLPLPDPLDNAGLLSLAFSRRLRNAMRYQLSFALWLLAWCLTGAEILAAEPVWKAGVAKANITPTEPLWLAGYGGRSKPAEGKVMELWIKVLALEDARGRRAVILTSDTLGIPQSIYTNVCAGV